MNLPSQLACPEFLLCEDCRIPSPCFVIDENRLETNAHILDKVQRETGARILLALKGYAAWKTFPLLSRAANGPLWGCCASSVHEARLAHEEFGGEVHAFAAAWTEEEIRQLLHIANHIVFNSLSQWRKCRPMIMQANDTFRKINPIQCGLRINPEHSEGAPDIYNPCSPGSRLGIRHADLEKAGREDLDGITGLHFHTLCEQDATALARTLEATENKFKKFLKNCQWLNFGGGHHITRPGYQIDLLCKCIHDWQAKYGAQIYLEPGEAVALNAGWLFCTVLDIVQADMPIAILDVSAACHMPDVLEMPYTPQVYYSSRTSGCHVLKAGSSGPYSFRLAGKSCLAGDVIGEYSFISPLEIGQKLAFADMAIYSMVKTTTFNGLTLPGIGIYGNSGFKMFRSFGYEDFKCRLS